MKEEIQELRALLRQALEALEYCLEDSYELINIRSDQWGEYKLDQQKQMREKYEEHANIHAAIKARLGEKE